MVRESHTTGEWKKRSVVSSFILKVDAGEPRIALFLRSDKVSTYRHHLAPISGSIDTSDPSALAAAWRELSEETTLTPTMLSLFRQGKPYTFRDDSIRREWTIFPFLFRLRAPVDEQQIRIDWEHEGWEWHDPDVVIRNAHDSLKGAPTVPRLAESLRRVWFETDLGPVAGKLLSDRLDALANDYESGARQMADAALQTLRDVAAKMDGPDNATSDEWWVKVRFAAWHLWKNGRESMGAAIMSALLAALAAVEKVFQESPESGSWRDGVLRALDARITARRDSATLISQAFVTYLAETFSSKLASRKPISILTLSESSTIRQALRHAALEDFVLILHVLESRPLFEGVSLAGSLADELPIATTSTHTINLYSDASAALASVGVDVLVLGADRIAASGAVSNKTGSLPAVLSAKHVSPSAKVVVLGESDKIALPGRPEDHVVEDNDPAQISRAWQAEYNSESVRDGTAALLNAEPSSGTGRVNVNIRNVFFEWVPASLIDAYVTEFGEWTGQQITRHSEKLAIEEKRLFGSL